MSEVELVAKEDVRNVALGDLVVQSTSSGELTTDLNKDQLAKVDEFKSKLDWKDSQSTMTFGLATQRKVDAVSRKMLDGAISKDLGSVGGELRQLVAICKGLQDDSNKVKAASANPEPSWFERTVKGAMSLAAAVENLIRQYQEISPQIDKLEGTLMGHRTSLFRNIVLLDEQYDASLDHFRELELVIIAAKMAMEDCEAAIQKAQVKAKQTNSMVDATEAKDLVKRKDELNETVTNLMKSRQLFMMALPDIRIQQDIDKQIVRQIQNMSTQGLTVIRSTLGRAVLRGKSRDAQNAVDSTADFIEGAIQSGMDDLGDLQQQVHAGSIRGIASIEVIESANAKLIEIIENTASLVEQSREANGNAQSRLRDCENQLKDALMRVN